MISSSSAQDRKHPAIPHPGCPLLLTKMAGQWTLSRCSLYLHIPHFIFLAKEGMHSAICKKCVVLFPELLRRLGQLKSTKPHQHGCMPMHTSINRML